MGIFSTALLAWLTALILVQSVTALPGHHVDDQFSTTVEAGSFQDPSVHVRPKFRYWLPDASVDPNLVAADIKEIGSKGAGGIELLSYYMYGGSFGTVSPTDWNIYGFGTPAYNKVLKAAAKASKDNGLIMDFCMGPQSGQGVPADWNDPGLAYDLVSFNITVSPGSSYNGEIPGYGAGILVSVTTGMITKQEFRSDGLGNFGAAYSYTLNTLSADSITDVTSKVRANGTLSMTFPANQSAISYIIYASFYALSHVEACIPGSDPDPQNFIQNGSFAVDHFSVRGAKVTTDFLEKYVFVDGVKELMQQVGKYIWEDSVEIPSPVYWTPALASVFKKMHGYDIGKYSILLAQNNGGYTNTYLNWFVTDGPDQGQGYVADYRATLGSLLNTYYDAITAWSNDYLGLQFSAQVGYNLPVDMLDIIPHVNVPEDEQLQANGNPDAYRQFIGAANIAGKRIVSIEVGAEAGKIYMQTLPSLFTASKAAWAVGMNQLVFHGATFSHQYPNTTWPGFSTFNYLFGEQHSRHQPGWENGYSDFLNFAGRTQYVLQKGIPKRDVVFWNKKSGQGIFTPPLYDSLDLLEAGYGYEYVTPENFNLPLANVRDKTLAPDGPAYKVLIIRRNDTFTTAGISRIVQFAHQGLPIMLYGGLPTLIASPNGLAQAQAQLQSITLLRNVYEVSTGSIASAVAAAGILPLTKVNSNGTWYTYWREDNKAKDSYIFVYNDGAYSEGTISFASTRTPYLLDAWTGDQIPALQYTVDLSYTTIPFKLAQGQSLIVAFFSSKPSGTPSAYITSAPSTILGYSYSKSEGLIAKLPKSATQSTIKTSDRKTFNLPAQDIPAVFSLNNWTLIAEKWGPSSNLSDIETTIKTNTTYTLQSLTSWQYISGLANASGVGYYNTTFFWNDTSTSAIINFGRIVHTLRVKINGHQLPPLDYSSPKSDITQFLVHGINYVDAVAATTMFNGLIPIWNQMRTNGYAPLFEVGQGALFGTENGVEVGLVGNVTVTPYKAVRVF